MTLQSLTIIGFSIALLCATYVLGYIRGLRYAITLIDNPDSDAGNRVDVL